jgi:large subunit ribosomal protein L29
MKPAAIREMTDEELTRAIEDNRREALNLRLQAQTGQLENTARIRTVRRDVARFVTEQTAREQQNRNVD